jgi:cytochrome P450
VRFREIRLVVGQSLDGVWDLRQARELATARRELVAMFARLAAERRAERDNELVARDLLATAGCSW